MTEHSTLGANLKRAREAAGLTQKQAAELADVTPQAISGWERGANLPKEANIQALARVYRVPPASLRYGTHTEPDLVTADGIVMEYKTSSPNKTPEQLAVDRLARSHAVRVWQKQFELELVRAGASDDLLTKAMQLVRAPQVFRFFMGGATARTEAEQDAIEAMEAVAHVIRDTYTKRHGLKFTDTFRAGQG